MMAESASDVVYTESGRPKRNVKRRRVTLDSDGDEQLDVVQTGVSAVTVNEEISIENIFDDDVAQPEVEGSSFGTGKDRRKRPAKKRIRRAQDSQSPRRKQRKTVESDAEFNELTEEDAPRGGDASDQDFENEDAGPAQSSSKKGKGGNSRKPRRRNKPGRKAVQGKGEERESLEPPEPKPRAQNPRVKADPITNEIDGVESSGPTLDMAQSGQQDQQSSSKLRQSPMPKKQKLPSIKKIKALPNGASTPTGTPAANKPAPVPAKSSAADAKGPLTSAEFRRAAVSGTAEVNLSNADVYKELFQSTPGFSRSGVNRREKEEERRRELDRMRDEAREKRLAEAHHNTFDLQAELERISAYEERMLEESNIGLPAHYLAARWKEDYDQEKAREMQELEDESKEEGEM